MAWSQDLEEGSPAFAIAACDCPNVRVVAGPGSGKSFAMKRRVARLLEAGVDPQSILPVTFTRVAAEDLHRELVGMDVEGCNRHKMNEITNIRSATRDDSVELASLLDQLGYAVSTLEVAERIGCLVTVPTEAVLVAERDGSVIGVISVHLIPLFHARGNLGRITAFVVHEASRGQGVGKQLFHEAERWAWSHDCSRMEVTSGDDRDGAHRFYEACGFRLDERRFLKLRP